MCEIAEVISEERMRNFLHEDLGMQKVLHKVGAAFAEWRSKSNEQTFATMFGIIQEGCGNLSPWMRHETTTTRQKPQQ
jgi:hypothetical protein